ncbi:MAG: ABC transporter ATP-binding protein [Acidimicrobiales bacterium]
MSSGPVTSATGDYGATEPANAKPPVLQVKGLRAEFHLRHSNVRAVDDVSLAVRPGECLGLVGESGCGKTTTGLAVMNLLPNVGHIAGGSIQLAGRELVGLSEKQLQKVRGNEVAMVFQDPMTSLNPTWTIGRQIAEPVRIHKGATKSEALERAVEVLRLVGMPRPEERLHQYPHQLSGGLRQRVMIAMALSCEPRLLIADEPTTALDVTIQAQILDLIDDLRRRLDMAVLLITHDMGVIAERADRVMVMYAGKVAEAATTTSLFASMRHPYSEALFGSIPRLNQDKSERLYSIPGLPPDLSKTFTSCRFAPRCPYATKECTEVEPPLTPDGSGGAPVDALGEHVFACFHPVLVGTGEREAMEAKGGNGAGAPVAPAMGAGGDVTVSPYEILGVLEAGVGISPVGDHVNAGNSEQRADRLAGREAVLEVVRLDKQYPVTSGAVVQRSVGTVKAVSGVSFTVRRGETFGLVGESGCGKTTTGRLVVALERPTGGTIRFEGDDLSALRGRRLRLRRREMQLMFQDPYSSLDPRMRVRSIIREPLLIQHEGTRREQDERISEVLAEVGLAPKAGDLYPHEFSGGQRQRIGLARALVLQPKLIVTDEPVSALDVSVQAQILNLMRSLQERHGLTYILISHDLAVVKYLADTIGVMYLGKMVEVGPAEDVYHHPAHPYTRGLIDTIPVPDPLSRKGGRKAAMQGELPSAISPPSGCRFRTRCPFAQEVCAAEEPPLRAFGPGHLAACHFPLEQPLEEEPASLSGARA